MSISVGGNYVDAYKGKNACFYTRSADDEEKDLSIYFENAADEGEVHCMIKVGYKDGTTKEIEFPADFVDVDDDGDDESYESYKATYMITDMADVVIVMACFSQPFEDNIINHLDEFDERFKDELAH